jgi:hypothetical protein
MASFIQGFLASLMIDSVDITLVTADVTLSESRTALDKSVMDGSGTSQQLAGKRSGTLAINGHVDQENLTLLEAAWAKSVALTFTLEITQGIGTSDASWSGTVTLTDFTKSTSADGNWAFTLAGEIGPVAFTPMVPVP